MSANSPTDAYVRTEEAPLLPPPVTMVGVPGWILTNLFPSIGNGIRDASLPVRSSFGSAGGYSTGHC